MNVSHPDLLRAPFLLFSRVYRIVERKCRIVRGFFLAKSCFSRRRMLFFVWESIGQYQRGVEEGDVFGLWRGFWIIKRAYFRSPDFSVGGDPPDRAG
jgi:hypothetical protein